MLKYFIINKSLENLTIKSVLVQLQVTALVGRASIEIMMATVQTLTSVLLEMIVIKEQNVGIQSAVTDVFVKVVI